MIDQEEAFIGLIGILLQVAGALLLGGLFLLLRLHARRRKYFGMWGWAWLTLGVGISAIAARYILPPALTAGLPLEFIYQLAKLTHFALLVAGTAMYASGASVTPFLPVAIGLSAAYALVALYFASGWMQVVAWQAPVALVALGWCALRLFNLPSSRRGVGTRIAGLAFAGMALTWALYFPAFTAAAAAAGGDGSTLDPLVRFNSFIDLLLHMILGSGMVVVLMEDAKREVDDAHAELAVAHNDLRRAALYDAVTGTLNRRAFTEGVGLETARARFGAVMMVDLDDLKGVNDSHGHSAGDALLRHLVEAVRHELRPSDKLYRWGGDEFLLVLPGADAARAEVRLRGVIGRAAAMHLGSAGPDVRLSVSLGSVGYHSAEEMLTAIDRADAMMYQDKSRKKLSRTSGSPAA